MDLEQFLEEDIITFLESKVETRGKTSVDREDDYGLYITKDYVKELETALQNDNLSRAKKLFDELKAIYNTYNQPLGKKKIYIMLDEMYKRITAYVEQAQDRKTEQHAQEIPFSGGGINAFASSQQQPVIIIKNAIIENFSEKKSAVNALPEEIAVHPVSEQHQQKMVAQEKVIAKKNTEKSSSKPLFIVTPKISRPLIPEKKEEKREVLSIQDHPLQEKQEHLPTPLFKPPIISRAPSPAKQSVPQKQSIKQSLPPIVKPTITKAIIPPHSVQRKSSSPEMSAKEIHQLYSSGLRELYHQRFSEAQTFFEQIIARDPNNRAARIRKEQCQEASINDD